MNKIESVANSNLIPFKIFKSLFPNSTTEALYATKDSMIELKTYNNLTIEQLDVVQ